ncbi:MAG: hypothetical protein NTZ18_03810 [Candidatus Komeilibacteria bacterium]|nr:hypothetical protein [Candidatus Komeilibacteria bacterium]
MKIGGLDKKIFKMCGWEAKQPYPDSGKVEEYIKRLTKYDFPRFHVTKNLYQPYFIHIDLRRMHFSWLPGTVRDRGTDLAKEVERLRQAHRRITKLKNRVYG